MKKYCPFCKEKKKTMIHNKLRLCSKCGYALGHKDLDVHVTLGAKMDEGITPFLIE